MTGWECPRCGADDVCSRQEWTAVYNYRSQIRQTGPMVLARALAKYDRYPRKAEDGEDLVHRWANGDGERPNYICANCRALWSGQEVPA